MTIKLKLHLRMAELKMNQKELSQLSGIRPNSISAYISDTYKQIPKEHLDIFCKIFKCQIEDLIEYVNDDE